MKNTVNDLLGWMIEMIQLILDSADSTLPMLPSIAAWIDTVQIISVQIKNYRALNIFPLLREPSIVMHMRSLEVIHAHRLKSQVQVNKQKR